MITNEQISEVVATAVPPAGTVDVAAIIVSEPGGTLPNGTPNGLGGRTRFGAGWFDGLKTSEPIGDLLGDTPKEAARLIDALKGEGSELWERKEQRRRIIAEMEAAEEAAEQEAKDEAKLERKTQRQLKRAGVDISDATGGGSSRPSRSREKRTATTGKPSGARRLVRRKA